VSQNTPFLPLDATLPRCLLSLCLSVCTSQAGIVSKRLDKSSWFLARRLPSNCPKEIWAPPGSKIRVYYSLELCLRLRTLKISLRQVDGSRCQQSSSSSLSTSTVELVDDTYTTVHDRVVAVYYKSVYCNPLTPSLRYVVDSLYNLFLQLTRF